MKRLVAVSAGVIALCCGLPWLHDRTCHWNTVYSERYSEDAVRRIGVGMARATVIEALGAPLVAGSSRVPAWTIRDEATRNRFHKDDEVATERLIFSQAKNKYHDFHLVCVTIGPEGTVIEIDNYLTD